MKDFEPPDLILLATYAWFHSLGEVLGSTAGSTGNRQRRQFSPATSGSGLWASVFTPKSWVTLLAARDLEALDPGESLEAVVPYGRPVRGLRAELAKNELVAKVVVGPGPEMMWLVPYPEALNKNCVDVGPPTVGRLRHALTLSGLHRIKI